jgi:hypothetical protein
VKNDESRADRPPEATLVDRRCGPAPEEVVILRKLTRALAIWGALLLSPAAPAAPPGPSPAGEKDGELASYEFHGVVDRVGFDGADDPFRGTIRVGQSFEGRLTLDPAAGNDGFSATARRSHYEMGHLASELVVRWNDHTFESDLTRHVAESHVVSLLDDFNGVDELTVSTSGGFVKHAGPELEGVRVEHLTIILTDPTQKMLDSDALPFRAPADLGSLSLNALMIGGTLEAGRWNVVGHLTALRRIAR